MVAAAIGAWLVAISLAFRVHVETDILALVPRDNPTVESFKTTVERFGAVDTLLVAIHLTPDRPIEPALAYADFLAESLRDWHDIDWVEYRVRPSVEAVVPLLQGAALFLDPDQLDELLAGLDDEGLSKTAARLRSDLLAPQAIVTKDVLRLDPMGLLPKILSKVKLGGIGARVDPETGYIMDKRQRFLLMMVRPVRPAQDLEFDRELVAGLHERARAAEQAWRNAGWEELPPEVEFTGGYVIALDDSRLITSDLVIGLVFSLAGVMTLFLLAFRRRAALVYAFFPLMTGLALAFSFGAVALGRVNSLTSAFGGLLIGLGIDFVVVLYARYVEERQGGASHEEAVDAMGRHTGVGVLLGAVTTAATFYAFLVTDFAGLWELGLLTGTGILLLALSVFLLLPALLTIIQLRGGRDRPLHLHSFGSHLLGTASLRHPRITIAVAAAATVGLGFAATRLGWDDDFRNMRSGDNRAILLRQEVMDAFDLRFSPMMLRFDGKDEAEALAKCAAVLPALDMLVDGKNLVGVDTIAGLIPSPEEQAAAIEKLARAAPQIEDLDRRFADALRGAGLNPRAFSEGVARLVASLERTTPLSLTDLENTPLAHVVDRYVARAGDEASAVIYCYPPLGQWRRGASPALQDLVTNTPGAILVGTNVISAELRRIVWDDAVKASVLGMILVFLLMWIDLGGPLKALLALVPLTVGMIWMLGGMSMLGMRLNFLNVFVLTMIIGIGVDYGVHLLHRWHETAGDPRALAETGKAVTVAALTTVVGFGSFVLSHYPGLRSVGAAAILGALSTAVLSITLLPVLLRKGGTR